MNKKKIIGVIIILLVILIVALAVFWHETEPLPSRLTQISPLTTNNVAYPHVLQLLPEEQLPIEQFVLFPKIKVTNENKEAVIETTKEWLLKNSKFTGVTEKSNLVVAGAMEVFNQLRIDFRNQTYNGLSVEGDAVPFRVFAHPNGVSRFSGRWLPITAPLEPKILEELIKNKLVGKIIKYGDVAGNLVNYSVGQKDLNNAADKVVFIKKTSQGLECRLAWKIRIGQQGIPSWIMYIDAITGEELQTIQGFNT